MKSIFLRSSLLLSKYILKVSFCSLNNVEPKDHHLLKFLIICSNSVVNFLQCHLPTGLFVTCHLLIAPYSLSLCTKPSDYLKLVRNIFSSQLLRRIYFIAKILWIVDVPILKPLQYSPTIWYTQLNTKGERYPHESKTQSIR